MKNQRHSTSVLSRPIPESLVCRLDYETVIAKFLQSQVEYGQIDTVFLQEPQCGIARTRYAYVLVTTQLYESSRCVIRKAGVHQGPMNRLEFDVTWIYVATEA